MIYLDKKVMVSKHEYHIMILKYNQDYEVCMWANNGSTSLLHRHYTEEGSWHDDLDLAMSLFECGFVDCANCGRSIKYSENRDHRYYAGIYCLECWETKYKKIAEEENYD